MIYKGKYRYVFDSYPELDLLWDSEETHRRIVCDKNGRKQDFIKIRCSKCNDYDHDLKYGEGWVRWMPDLKDDYIRKGFYVCHKCRNYSEASKKAIETIGHEGLSNRAKKINIVCFKNGTGVFSEERKEKQRELCRSQKENKQGMWSEESTEKRNKATSKRLKNGKGTNKSKWEQQIAIKYGGVCGLCFSKGGKQRWPDIVFPDGHVIQIDDKSHSKKYSRYEYDYDVACFEEYGYRPLHLMCNHIGVIRRPGYNNANEIIESYLKDELSEDMYIMVEDEFYGNIDYPEWKKENK